MLNYINVNKITSHPDNPRKSLGDLSELTESIRANGIFQNLTVVPWVSVITGQPGDNGSTDDQYTVVIGHRRLAAAVAAGLTEVPCIITDMTKQEQVSTMLLENMQRSDLTVYEQACGFQMMLDMGESVNDISSKTGFSESTVRHRIKLAELDQDVFKKSVARNASIKDYIELEQIESSELKNKVLAEIGTNNFKYKLQQALDSEAKEKEKKKIVEKLETFANRFDGDIYNSGLTYVRDCYNDSFDIPDDTDEKEYFYQDSYYVKLYVKKDEQDEEKSAPTAYDIAEQARIERVKQCDEIAYRAFELRYDFIENYSATNAKKNIATIAKMYAKMYAKMIIKGENSVYNVGEKLSNFLKIVPNTENDRYKEIERLVDIASKSADSAPERVLLLCIVSRIYDSAHTGYSNYAGKHKLNEKLDDIYSFLIDLGYEMSDEEKRMQDGTHELFKKDE